MTGEREREGDGTGGDGTGEGPAAFVDDGAIGAIGALPSDSRRSAS